MALKNEKGNYLKITSVDTNHEIISWQIYKDEQTRINPSEFDSTHNGSGIYKLDEYPAYDAKKTLKQNLVSFAYIALKKDNQYKGWIDC